MHPYSVPELTSGSEIAIQQRIYVFQATREGSIRFGCKIRGSTGDTTRHLSVPGDASGPRVRVQSDSDVKSAAALVTPQGISVFRGTLQGPMHPYSVPELTSGSEIAIQQRIYVFQAIPLVTPQGISVFRGTLQDPMHPYSVPELTSGSEIAIQQRIYVFQATREGSIRFGCKIRGSTGDTTRHLSVPGDASGLKLRTSVRTRGCQYGYPSQKPAGMASAGMGVSVGIDTRGCGSRFGTATGTPTGTRVCLVSDQSRGRARALCSTITPAWFPTLRSSAANNVWPKHASGIKVSHPLSLMPSKKRKGDAPHNDSNKRAKNTSG
ncbi:hypothetical protein GGX14DRAFT_399889 [Mycena pura]|uniref:Uncharacterized protein n=1 Tax=Mycena pura TaxID=153505 RepID=A0AAD6V774_9AGAR|nr:hypothetical protein GGX14DRAFT_399889 [Mycena pura]